MRKPNFHTVHSWLRSLLPVSVLLAALLLTGCGKSGMTLSQRIEALENWTLPGLREDSTALVGADAVTGGENSADVLAETAGGLSEEEKAAAEAQAALHLEHQMQQLSGTWSELSDSLPLFRPIVSWFGNLVLKEDGTWRSDTASGSWEFSVDGNQIILQSSRGKTVADIVQDGAYEKLSVPDLHLNFFRKNKLKAYIEERFVFVDITAENVSDYIRKPVNIGVILDEKDKPTGDSAWVLGSGVYGEGLVYYGRSEDFSLTLQNNATGSTRVILPYDTLSLTTGATFGHVTAASGTLVFVRSEYVSDNRMTDARTRTLTFTDGTTHTTSLTWYSDLADYSDWKC